MTFPNCLSKRCLNDFQNYKYTLRWCSMRKTHKYAHLNLQFAHGIFIIKLCHELARVFLFFPSSLFFYLCFFSEGACWRRPRSENIIDQKTRPECFSKNNFDRLNKKNAINNMFSLFSFIYYLNHLHYFPSMCFTIPSLFFSLVLVFSFSLFSPLM